MFQFQSNLVLTYMIIFVQEVQIYEKKWEADRKRINSGSFVNGPKKRNPPKKNPKTSKKEPAGDPMDVSENTVPETGWLKQNALCLIVAICLY